MAAFECRSAVKGKVKKLIMMIYNSIMTMIPMIIVIMILKMTADS